MNATTKSAREREKAREAARAMDPVDPEEIRRRIYAQDFPALRRELVRHARGLRGVPEEDADDLANEAIDLEWDPRTRTWNPNEFPVFADHCKWLIHCHVRKKKRSGDGGRLRHYAPDHEVMAGAHAPGLSPERLVTMRDGANKLSEGIRAAAEAKKDRIVLGILRLRDEEPDDKPADWARNLGEPVTEIYKALDRLRDLEEAVAKSYGHSKREMLAGAAAGAPEVAAAPPPATSARWTWAWIAAHAAAVACFAAGFFLPAGGAAFALGGILYTLSLGFALLWVRAAWSSRRVATWACVLALVPGANLVVAPVAWVLHMRACDRALATIHAKA